jgi:hypothetical protein
METELQGCYILHVCAKELLAESERAISATVPHGHGLRQQYRKISRMKLLDYNLPIPSSSIALLR